MPDLTETIGIQPRMAAADQSRLWRPGWLVASLACLLAGAVFSTRTLHGVDLALMHGLNRLTGRWPLIDHVVHDLTKDTLSTAVMLSLLCMAWSAQPRWAGRTLLIAATLAASVSIVLCFVLQALMPDHPRPLHDPALAFRPPPSIDPSVFSPGMAFPAEQAGLLFALAMGITFVRPLLGGIAFILAGVLSLARVYLGFIYPSDVVAGAGVGMILVWLACSAPFLGLSSRIATAAQRHPGPFAAVAFFLCFGIGRLFEDERYIAHGLARALLHHH